MIWSTEGAWATLLTQKLPVHRLIELCGKINHPIILIGGKEDSFIGQQVAETGDGKIYNACGKFSLNESADLVRRSKLVISHDTGLQYIASALNKTVLAIWGSTSPRLDVEPYYSKAFASAGKEPPYENIIRIPELRCQPCSKYGNKKCPLGHFKCMEEMDINYIARRVDERLGR